MILSCEFCECCKFCLGYVAVHCYTYRLQVVRLLFFFVGFVETTILCREFMEIGNFDSNILIHSMNRIPSNVVTLLKSEQPLILSTSCFIMFLLS